MKKNKYENLFPSKYFETYAMLCLNDVLKLDLILRESRHGIDKPDLISNDETIGIEVTQGITTEEGNENKLFQQKYPRENKLECIKSEAKRLNINKNKINFHENFISLSQNCDSAYTQSTIIDTINKKIYKLNQKGFNIYNKNELCIFSSAFKEDIIQGLEKWYKDILPTKEYKYIYKKIYIINQDNLLVFLNGNLQNNYKINSYKYKVRNLLNGS